MGKSKWDMVKEKLPLIEGWCRNGLTEEQIIKNLGISVQTFYNYKREHIELVEVLKRGKEVIDLEVENALLKRALGYRYTEVKTETDQDGNEKVTKTIKEVIPDTTAQIFWLKNRKPREWRDRKDIEHSGNINNPYEGLTQEQLLKLASDDDG